MPSTEVVLSLAFLFAAAIYASVGHAGASAYLAVMALAGFSPGVMRPTALALNVIVAIVATHRFYTARCFAWRTLWPYVLGSVPLAFIGGMIQLPASVYRPVLGVVLLFAAGRMAVSQRWFQRAKRSEGPSPLPLSLEGRGGISEPPPLSRSLEGRGGREERSAQRTLRESPSSRGERESPSAVRRPPFSTSVGVGAALGFLSGLTGVGGGIFLSPLLLIARWAEVRETAGLSAAFILLNSIAGLLGAPGSLRSVPPAFPIWAIAVLVGGIVGSNLGSRHIPPAVLKRLLAFVLLVAAAKMLFS